MINIGEKIKSILMFKHRDPEAKAHEVEIKRAIRELQGLNDRELNDLGLSRYNIERAVRNTVEANDQRYQHSAA